MARMSNTQPANPNPGYSKLSTETVESLPALPEKMGASLQSEKMCPREFAQTPFTFRLSRASATRANSYQCRLAALYALR